MDLSRCKVSLCHLQPRNISFVCYLCTHDRVAVVTIMDAAKLSRVVCACDPRTWGVEAGDQEFENILYYLVSSRQAWAP